MRYYVATFGCRVNQADSAGIVLGLEDTSLVRTSNQKDADVVVLNTCTVTHRSDTDVRKAVHRIRRESPNARIIVTGCYAQRDPEAVAALGVEAVVGNGHKGRLPVLAEALADPCADFAPIVIHSSMEDEAPAVAPHSMVVDRTRPFVKIQDGCDAACTYCIIPSVRGPARSATPEDVLATIARLVEDGWYEIVLAGVHLGTYGAALTPRTSLPELVGRILEIDGVGRLRLSCIEPMAFPIELADIARRDRRLAPHFHLPLQSGSDPILKRMVRPYRAADYRDQIDAIRDRVPDACIGTDVIVGFPGETDALFADTCDFVGSAGIDYAHVFSYSDREGTASTRLDGKVDPRVIKERSTALHAVSEGLWTRFLDRQIGRTHEAVVLERDPCGSFVALTGNYCQVTLDGPLERNQGCAVEILGRSEARLVGRLSDRNTSARFETAFLHSNYT
jgi:threonylcarbamoyladenosine tRNA methylthiotransferase MtaB